MELLSCEPVEQEFHLYIGYYSFGSLGSGYDYDQIELYSWFLSSYYDCCLFEEHSTVAVANYYIEAIVASVFIFMPIFAVSASTTAAFEAIIVFVPGLEEFAVFFTVPFAEILDFDVIAIFNITSFMPIYFWFV